MAGERLRFTHLEIENWRNFRHVDIDLRDRVFLAGPNASGKSNFLDVFRFLHDLASVGGGLQSSVERIRGGVSKIRCLAARRYPDVRIAVRIGNDYNDDLWSYEISFNQTNQRIPYIKTERVSREGKKVFSRPDRLDEGDEDRLTQTYLEQVTANKDFREIVDFFSSIRYLHVVPQLVREPDRSVGKSEDPFGGDLLERIMQTQERTRRAWFRRITRALQVAVPSLQELLPERDERGVAHLKGRYKHWRPLGAWHSERDFSDGTLRLLGLLWAVLSGNGPLLLEEPELSLNPGVVRYLPQMFYQMQKRSGRQVIVSTHSPDLLIDEGIDPGEVLLLNPSDDGTEITPASNFQDLVNLLRFGGDFGRAVMAKVGPLSAEQLPLFLKE